MRKSPSTVIADEFYLDDVIGTGPYATVYRAFDADGRAVALKLYDPSLGRDKVFTVYFRRDMQTLRAVRHPQLVPVDAYGLTLGSYYFVSELVGSPTLDMYLANQQLSPACVAAIGAQLCRALEVMHAVGYMHGALKPANIFVHDPEHVLLTVAGGRRTHTDLAASSAERRLVAYLSPEQICGEGIDATTDVYGLGVVLYEACTGKLPFTGSDAATIASHRLSSVPDSLRSLRPEVSVELDGVISRCLERNPDARYRTAAELGDALATCSRVTASRGMGDVRLQG
ncbi:MAG: hypothetical protein PVSMB7_29210 [Chloroflexota bacterium]